MSNLLYNKDECDNENVWDDTALIRMYEDSINPAIRKKKTASTEQTSSNGWKVGDKCLAPYYEEDLWYPAQIQKFDGSRVEVLFDGYENVEWVELADITGPENADPEPDDSSVVSPERKKTKTRDSKKKDEARSSTSAKQGAPPLLPAFAPPPPPALSGLVPPSEMEALSSMLMSWYMSGYHTGYYQCISDQKKKEGK